MGDDKEDREQLAWFVFFFVPVNGSVHSDGIDVLLIKKNLELIF